MSKKRAKNGDIPIPLVILAGSDRRPVRLPAAGRSQHPISGYKGVDLRVAGRPLVSCVAERTRASGCFEPIYVVGPARLYRELALDARLIDADGSVGGNIRAAVEEVQPAHPGSPIAFITCDVLPDVDTLREVMAEHAAAAPLDVFCPLVRVPEGPAGESALGMSAWKPTYALVPRGARGPIPVLPGHLIVGDPAALRLDFFYRLLNLTYRTRNRSLKVRRNVLLRGIVLELLYQDLRHLLSLRAPTLTVTVIGIGLRVALGLKRGTLGQDALEAWTRRVLVTVGHRRQYPERRVRLPIIEGLSLARDIDTEEEAHEMGVNVEGTGAVVTAPGAPPGAGPSGPESEERQGSETSAPGMRRR